MKEVLISSRGNLPKKSLMLLFFLALAVSSLEVLRVAFSSFSKAGNLLLVLEMLLKAMGFKEEISETDLFIGSFSKTGSTISLSISWVISAFLKKSDFI